MKRTICAVIGLILIITMLFSACTPVGFVRNRVRKSHSETKTTTPVTAPSQAAADTPLIGRIEGFLNYQVPPGWIFDPSKSEEHANAANHNYQYGSGESSLNISAGKLAETKTIIPRDSWRKLLEKVGDWLEDYISEGTITYGAYEWMMWSAVDDDGDKVVFYTYYPENLDAMFSLMVVYDHADHWEWIDQDIEYILSNVEILL